MLKRRPYRVKRQELCAHLARMIDLRAGASCAAGGREANAAEEDAAIALVRAPPALLNRRLQRAIRTGSAALLEALPDTDAPTTFPTTVEFDRLLDMGAPALLAIAARKGLGLGHGKGVARLVDLAGSDPDWRHLLLDVFGPGKPPLCLNKANAWTNSYIYEARDKEMLAAFLKVQVRANPDAFAVAIVTSLTLDRAKQALAMLASGARPSVRLLEERGPAMRRYVSPDTLAVLEGLTSAHGQLALLRGSRPLAELLVPR